MSTDRLLDQVMQEHHMSEHVSTASENIEASFSFQTEIENLTQSLLQCPSNADGALVGLNLTQEILGEVGFGLDCADIDGGQVDLESFFASHGSC